MPTWEQFEKFVSTFGVPTAMLAVIVAFMWRYGARYIESVVKLHDSIGSSMGAQQQLCNTHGQVITSHDKAMRKAAIEACAMCRQIAEK
jgi:hypothetical protein